MKHRTVFSTAGAAAAGLAAALATAAPQPAKAETFTLRIGAGHPVAGLGYTYSAANYFAPEVARRVEVETDHEIRWIEAWAGTVAKAFEMINACDAGLLDVCAISQPFQPTQMFLHNMGSYIPFSETDPWLSVLAQRKVFDQMPWFTEVFEKQWNQKHLGIGAQSDYGMGSSFEWNRFEDLAGHKIAAAGPNLPWLNGTGATPVQTILTEAYNALDSGIYEALIIFPGPWHSYKLHETAKNFKIVGFGSVPWNALSINLDKWGELPPEVQEIMVEEGRIGYMLHSAYYEVANFERSQRVLREAGSTVTVLPAEERAKWAEALKDLPNTRAQEAEKRGMPACEAMNLLMEIEQQQGYEYPYEYEICG